MPYQNLNFRALSDPCQIMKLEMSPLDSNTICGEHKQELTIPCIREGTASGIIYWVQVNLAPSKYSLSTICHDSHCNQVVLFSSLDIRAHQKVNLKCQFWYGMVDIKISPAEK